MYSSLAKRLTFLFFCPRQDLNLQPKHLQSSARPIELLGLFFYYLSVASKTKHHKCASVRLSLYKLQEVLYSVLILVSVFPYIVL